MLPVPTVADAPPSGAAHCDPLAALDTEGRHLFGIGVLAMSADLTRTKADLVEARAEIGRQRRRIALQHATIIQIRRGEDVDPHKLLAAIDEALGEVSAAAVRVEVTPQPRGTVLGAVRADRAGLKAAPLPPDEPSTVEREEREDAEVECAGPDCDCGLCDAGPARAKPEADPSRAWWLRVMLTPLAGSAAGAAFLAALLFLATGEYASMAAGLGAAVPLTLAALLLRPRVTPKRGGAR